MSIFHTYLYILVVWVSLEDYKFLMKAVHETPEHTDRPAGWRGSREVWLEAAKKALINTGLEAVKIQSLASRLDIARTSFYWFFKDRNALLEALLDEWEEKNTGAFLDACSAYADTITEGILNLVVVFHDETLFEPQLDFAIRSWAHHSRSVAKRVNTADEERLSAIKRLFERFGFETGEADVRARTVYLTQIGYISMQVREYKDERMARVPGYVATFCGQEPTQRELARFHARLNYEPPPG